MEKKNIKKGSGKKDFLAMSMWTTDMLEDPNQFYKDMAAMAAAIEAGQAKSVLKIK